MTDSIGRTPIGRGYSITITDSVTAGINSVDIEVLKSSVSHYVELFEIDCTGISGIGVIYYLTTEPVAVSFGGTSYIPFPIIISGVESSSDGAPSRPTIELSNVANTTGILIRFIGNLAFLYGDLIGAQVTYIRTFAQYLGYTDRVSAPPLKYFIAKKLAHNRTSLKFELRSPIDKERAYLPKRQMLKRDFPGLGINKRIN